jgi:hypothetical protein
MDNSFTSPGAPPSLTPPPVITPPPPSKPRKSRGWMIVAIIVIVLLVVSLFANLTQFVSHALSFNNNFNSGFKTTSARQIGPKLDECMLEDNDSRTKIAVITVDGIITSSTARPGGQQHGGCDPGATRPRHR